MLAARRYLLPAVLGLLSLSCGVVAVRVGPGGAQDAAESLPPAEAPVLSARRVPALLARTLGDRRLGQALEAVWASSPPTSCLVVAQGPRGVYERQPDEALVPASLAKLVTALGILGRFEPDERLRTSVRSADPGGPVVEGDLWLVGGGDPLLGTGDWAANFERQPVLYTPIEALADRVVRAGVREVRGRVVGDDSRYDRARYGPTWPPRYAEDNVTGPLSALSVNDGFADWEPPLVPFEDPAAGGAAVLTELLRQRGVTVAGEPVAGLAPADAPEVAGLDSAPMGELVGQMLLESDNGTAELLTKELGLRVSGQGTTEAGAAALAEAGAAAGLPMAEVVVEDGSGLDLGNRLTCDLVHELLSAAPSDSPIRDGLPVAGRTGTLTDRFVGGPAVGRLRAKTGTLNGVAGLAGYAEVSLGRALTFAYVVNGIGPAAQGQALQDRLAATLGSYPAVPGVDELGPKRYPGAA